MALSVKDFTMPAAIPATGYRSMVLVALVGLACFLVLLVLPTRDSQAAVIVLDPGHGGNDSGAHPDSGFAEKRFTLALAQKIADLLAPHHRVELTRTSDVQMAPDDRAASANHLQADLMVSIHEAVSPYCSVRNAAVYYHDDERLLMPSEASLQGISAESDNTRPIWAKLQMRHQHESQYLADTIKRVLGDSPSFDSVTVSGVPLVALMGADLPAVLVEVGCIHPAEAPNPEVIEQRLDEYAAVIASAIETALPGLAQ